MFLLVACDGFVSPAETGHSDFEVIGTLQDANIREASGLGRSALSDRLWVINDSGFAPKLHAIGFDGSDQGDATVTSARNIDWEDLATFSLGGEQWIVIADIGDNAGKRDECQLYFVREPTAAEFTTGEVTANRQLRFVYPDGPRDAESIAIDIDREKILVLSKRTIPAVLYSLPLFFDSESLHTASRIGEITSIPQPTQHDIERAPVDLNWFWQPNAMDISTDNKSAAILTYDAVYHYSRSAGQTWFEAFQREPVRYALGPHAVAESVVYSVDGREIFVTSEKRNAPLLKTSVIQSEDSDE